MVHSSRLIQLLLKYGARPEYKNWEKYLSSEQHAAHKTTKVFVVGDPGVGKSSLTMSLKIESKGGLSSLVDRVKKMRGVDEKQLASFLMTFVMRSMDESPSWTSLDTRSFTPHTILCFAVL